MLESDFVVGWNNIADEDYVGSSHGYTCQEAAVGTTNGAGARNTQILVLSPGGTVLHALPGFWHPDDLATELQFSKAMYRLWKDRTRSRADKNKMAARMQLAALRTHSPAMFARSSWQGFDQQAEVKRLNMGADRDTFVRDSQGELAQGMRLKPINVLVHERMAQRPFESIRRFDVAEFADYGRDYYDNNARVDGTGVRFGTKGYMASQKRQADRKKARAAKKEKKVKASRP